MDSHLTRELDSDRFDFLKFVYKAKHGEDIEHLVRYDKETRRLSICDDGHQASESLTDIQSQIDDILQDMERTFYLNNDITITREKEAQLDKCRHDLEVSQTDHILVLKRHSSDEDGTITVVLMGYNTESVMQHKHSIEVAVGIKAATSRGTRVFKRSDESSDLLETRFDEKTRATDNKETFLTYEGMEVSICSGNIVELEGENTCIVNPTNDKYNPTGGVSKALLAKGGDTYETELRGLRSNRPKVGDCSCTTAGNMKVTKVIHLVCPGVKWSPQVLKDKKCGANIIRSIHNCLQMAEDEYMAKIVLPFIYTGKLSKSVKGCCLLYAYAVLEYSRTRHHRENRTLQEIVFLSNISEHVNDAVWIFQRTIPQRYEQWLKLHQDLSETDQDTEQPSTDSVHGRRSEAADNSTVVNETDAHTGDGMAGRSQDEDKNSRPIVNDQQDSDSHTTGVVLRKRRNETDEHIHGARATIRNLLTCGAVVVDFKLEDIRSYFVRALVCPVGQSPDEVSGNGLIGASIKAAYSAVFCDNTIEERVSKKLYRKCVTLTTCGDLPREDARRTRYIFHVVFPTYKRKGKQKFEEDVTKSLDALFKRVQRENRRKKAVIEELAFPMFGIDSTSDIEAVREACTSIARSLYQSLLRMDDSTPFKMTIYFVNWCPKLHYILQEEFSKVWNQNVS